MKKSKEGRWNGYMGAGYSLTRTCKTCKETKEWNRFVLGTENMKDLCRDCYRESLKEKEDGRVADSSKNMDNLLAFLNKKCNKKK